MVAVAVFVSCFLKSSYESTPNSMPMLDAELRIGMPILKAEVNLASSEAARQSHSVAWQQMTGTVHINDPNMA